MEEKYVNLNKVYTKRGDKGETDLVGGSKARKDSLKVESYGSIDETSAFLGLVRIYSNDEEVNKLIKEIQNKLLIVGGYLASDDNGKEMLKSSISDEDIKFIEEKIDFYNDKLEPLFKFILPGDEKVSTYLHVARTVVRRAERKIVSLSFAEELNPNIQKYVNRLSDLFFVLGRYFEEVKNK